MSASFLTGSSGSGSLVVWMAWRRYLTTVRAADAEVYELVEGMAWARLLDELTAVGRPLPDQTLLPAA